MEKGLVSVIIPNYNYAKFIGKTIDSVLAQSYRPVEIIVVDDGSTDDSLSIIEGFGEKVTLIKQQNQGVSHARNNGFHVSKGEYIAFLDADDLWHPEKLERQIRLFRDEAEIGFVHCSMTLIDPQENPLSDHTDGRGGYIADAFLTFDEGAVIGAGSTGVVTRQVFGDVGGFDPRLSTAADWDFCFRIATKYKIGFVHEPMVLYRVHNSNMHSNIKVMEHDMLLGFKKAFALHASPKQDYCYGNLHRVLAGSYFRAGQYGDFLTNAAKSIWYRPAGFGYFAMYPFRKLFGGSVKKGGMVEFAVIGGRSFCRRMRKSIANIGYDVQVRNRDFAAALCDVIQDDDTFLDAGCGDLFIRSYIDRGKVIGIDIKMPKSNGGRGEFVNGSMLSLPFGERSFSFTGALDVIEHLPLDSRDKAIRELVRTCRSGVLIGFPFAGRPERLDVAFYEKLSGRSRGTPEWLHEHLNQRYPAMEEIEEIIRSAFIERGDAVQISVSFSESIAITKVLRAAAVVSGKVYVLANTLFGLTIPVHPNSLSGANSYRAVIFARVKE